MKRMALPVALSLAIGAVAFTQEKPTKLTVGFPKAHCDACGTALRAGLGKVQGAKFQRDEKESVWTWLEIADITKTDVGAIAKAVSAVDTPHKEAHPPGMFLLVFKKHETSIEGIRQALASVKGVDLKKTFNGDLAIWIALDGSGQAKLADIKKGFADQGIQITIDRPKDKD